MPAWVLVGRHILKGGEITMPDVRSEMRFTHQCDYSLLDILN